MLDYCKTAGFTVREWDEAGGGFSVTSGADTRFKVTKVVDLAGSLREAGYLVDLEAGDREPCLTVNVPPPSYGSGPRGSRTAEDHDRPRTRGIGPVLVAVIVTGVAMSLKIVRQYERGVLFRLGRVNRVREPGLRVIIPIIDVLRRVSLRIVTMPIQSQGIITRDNVSSGWTRTPLWCSPRL